MTKKRFDRRNLDPKYKNWRECPFCMSFAPFSDVHTTRKTTRRRGSYGVLTQTVKQCKNCKYEIVTTDW